MKKVIFLVAGLFVLAGCQAPNNEATKQSTAATTATTTNVKTASTADQENEISIVLTLKNGEEEIANKELTIPEDKPLFDVLNDEFNVVEDNGLVTEIEGLKQDTDQQVYWTFTINGEWATKGVKETMLKDNDKVVFTYGKM